MIYFKNVPQYGDLEIEKVLSYIIHGTAVKVAENHIVSIF